MAQYDRKAEDLGNITGLEHVNLQIPDQALGNLFYIQGLGLTRDPYMNTGLNNMWINVGKSQFHLPAGDPWVLRGAIALVTGIVGFCPLYALFHVGTKRAAQ